MSIIIEKEFGPWQSGLGNQILRTVNSHSVWITLETYKVVYWKGSVSINLFQANSLAEAVQFADDYIMQNFTVPESLEKQLAAAQEEIQKLKAQVAALKEISQPSMPNTFYNQDKKPVDAVATKSISVPDGGVRVSYIKDDEALSF